MTRPFVLSLRRRAPVAFLASAAYAAYAACALGACSQPTASPPPDPKSAAGAAAATSAAPSAGTLALGERVTSPIVPLADIAKDPARYRGQTLATTGKVTAVCQEMGCWMELEDGSGRAHVRMHGHQFFVPKTSPGHLARVQATLVPSHGAAACGASDCAEESSKAAQLELDATGVEID